MEDKIEDVVMSESDKEATSEESSVSESDDDLEETPAIIRQSHSNHLDSSRACEVPTSRLDALLAEHKVKREKDETAKLRVKLLTDIPQGSEAESADEDTTQNLASEHADVIEQLEVKASQLKRVQPGHTLFHAEQFCCLFDENIHPFSCGFATSGNCIGINLLLANITPSQVPKLLSSRALVTCAHQISCLDSIMRWLLSVLSVHTSPTVVHNCQANLIGILHQLKLKAKSDLKHPPRIWTPTAFDILRLLVNLGADPSKLIVHQNAYEAEELRKRLVPVKDSNVNKRPEGSLSGANVGKLLTVIAESLQARLVICKEELSFMLYMLATSALDLTSKETYYCLENNFQLCFASILECYSCYDWPSVVPDICRQLNHVSDQHHNLAHLVHLLPVGHRSSYLRVRLSYFFLNKLLAGREEEISDEELENLKIRDVAELGKTTKPGYVSELCSKFRRLVQKELYKATSVLKLIDFSVGDEFHRSTQPMEELEFVLSEVNCVLKGMKDNVNNLDVTRVKETISQLTGKWSLTLQSRRLTQRSMYMYDTATMHQPVKEEPLQNMPAADEDSS